MRTRPKPQIPKPRGLEKVTRAGEPRKRMLSEKTKARIREQEAEFLKMKAQGATEHMIAEALGMSIDSVRRTWQTVMAEWNGDHRKLVDTKFAEMLAAHEAEIRESYVWGAEDPAGAALVRHRARVAISRMCGHGNVTKIEHTGVGGGPIMTSQLAPMDAAALVRKMFSGIEPFTGNKADGSGRDTTH